MCWSTCTPKTGLVLASAGFGIHEPRSSPGFRVSASSARNDGVGWQTLKPSPRKRTGQTEHRNRTRRAGAGSICRKHPGIGRIRQHDDREIRLRNRKRQSRRSGFQSKFRNRDHPTGYHRQSLAPDRKTQLFVLGQRHHILCTRLGAGASRMRSHAGAWERVERVVLAFFVAAGGSGPLRFALFDSLESCT